MGPKALRERFSRWSGLSGTDGGIPWRAPIICLVVLASWSTLFGWMLAKTSWGSPDWPFLVPLVSGQSTILVLAGSPTRPRLSRSGEVIAFCVSISGMWIAVLGLGRVFHLARTSTSLEFAVGFAAAVIGTMLYTAISRHGTAGSRSSIGRMTTSDTATHGENPTAIQSQQGQPRSDTATHGGL